MSNEDSLGFISVKVIQNQQDLLREVALDAGVEPLGDDKYHCTVCYDVNNQAFKEHIPQLPFKSFEGKIIGVEELGNRKGDLVNAIAFVLESPELVAEHNLFKKVGHTHTFEDYIPHVSICYKVTPAEAERVKLIAQRLFGTVLYFDRESIEVID